MQKCKTIGCSNEVSPSHNLDYCPKCCNPGNKAFSYSEQETTVDVKPVSESSGGDNEYWLLHIADPKRLDPYTVECEDIIEALEMTFQEGEAFKALFRKCKIRLGDGKPGDTELRCSEKVEHFGNRMLVMDRRKLDHSQCNHFTH